MKDVSVSNVSRHIFRLGLVSTLSLRRLGLVSVSDLERLGLVSVLDLECLGLVSVSQGNVSFTSLIISVSLRKISLRSWSHLHHHHIFIYNAHINHAKWIWGAGSRQGPRKAVGLDKWEIVCFELTFKCIHRVELPNFQRNVVPYCWAHEWKRLFFQIRF